MTARGGQLLFGHEHRGGLKKIFREHAGGGGRGVADVKGQIVAAAIFEAGGGRGETEPLGQGNHGRGHGHSLAKRSRTGPAPAGDGATRDISPLHQTGPAGQTRP